MSRQQVQGGSVPSDLPSRYDPQRVESFWYERWLAEGVFRAETDPERQPFTIVIPPPNVTGSLHMGHALNNTLQDILVRRKRMQGYATLWLPGTDHAGIATQFVVEQRLQEEGLSRQELGREAFLERVWAWKEIYEARILGQLKRLGASCDWSRTRFTMDEGCSRAVRRVFVSLYRKGLIYRGEYMVNWCPRCRTTLADLEVEHREEEGAFYHIRYPLEGGGHVRVATTRPETILGDTAIAVHPEDARYRHLLGRHAVVPLIGRRIPLIADEWVDPEFGTGALKVTPGHDPNDFQIGQRHRLPVVQVMGPDGVMNEAAGPFQGLDRGECRLRLVEALREQGLLAAVEPHRHSVGHCYRCDTVIEPMLSLQWFVRMKPLAEPALRSVREGKTRISPRRFEKVYFHWLENIRDWPISRQIWWGHRIPAWYCEQDHVVVAESEPERCTECGSRSLRRDPDVLDTWFSSALWPFSTLGWPEETEDLRVFYPTSVLVTGYDILFFWVARMMFMGLEFMGKEPFRDVLLHGLVRDAQGEKMSKSRGNVIDPLETIDRYGADVLRWALVTGAGPGSDIRLSEDRIDAARDFANKLWNAARFVLLHRGDSPVGIEEIPPERLDVEDRWILHALRETVAEADRLLESYEIGEAARVLYDFFWSRYCDWYIEMAKPKLAGAGSGEEVTRAVLLHVLSVVLRLFHPYMPFITEEIWHSLPGCTGMIVRAPWPEAGRMASYPEEATQVERMMELVRALRNLRSEFRIEPKQEIDVILRARDEADRDMLRSAAETLTRLVRIRQLRVEGEGTDRPRFAATAVAGGVEANVLLEGLIDPVAERKRLEAEREDAARRANGLGRRLQDAQFLQKAPARVVEQERRRYEQLKEKIERLERRIGELR